MNLNKELFRARDFFFSKIFYLRRPFSQLKQFFVCLTQTYKILKEYSAVKHLRV